MPDRRKHAQASVAGVWSGGFFGDADSEVDRNRADQE
jgi:hypothetical protein